jgi:hypothetical protein
MCSVLRSTAAILIVGLALLGSLSSSQSQGRDIDILTRHIDDLEIKQPNIILALSAIANEYGVPIGLEAARETGEPAREVDLRLKNATLREVLVALVKQDSRYGWTVTRGVVNVYPTRHHDPLLRDLLGTKLGGFSIGDNPTTYRLRHSILELAEIKSKLEKAKVTPFVVALTGADYEKVGKQFSLHTSDVTLQQLLNQIVREGEIKFWFLNRYGKDKEFLILNF